MIEDVIEQWHRWLRGEDPDLLDELLHEDCVFYSPIVHTPQRGRDLTKLYLQAASQTLPGDASGGSMADGPEPDTDDSGRFRYTKKVLDGNTAVLEFETTVQGLFVNGVDIIVCDDDGRIVEFRVMIRPLKAVNLVHEQMRAMLERMQS